MTLMRRSPTRRRLETRALTALLLAAVATLTGGSMAPPAEAASPLLESVKQNPALARKMCARFRKLNAEGQSATARASIEAVARNENLSPMDAEVLITYVIGLHCPDVR